MTTLSQFGLRRFHVNVDGQVYIETGVSYGASMENAMKACWPDSQGNACKFEELYGIDVSENAARKCAAKFALDQRVKILCGPSAKWLSVVIKPDKKTVFWLDAHYEGTAENLAESGCQCPLLAELALILATPWKHKPVILIDDASAFMSRHVWWERYAHPTLNKDEWPEWSEIFEFMGGVDYKFNFLKADDGILYCW